jgi:multiple sugar transport system permease protein
VLFSVIDSVKIFDPIYALTTGGPGGATESLSYLIYLETSTFFNMGYGSAMAVITLFLVAIPVLLILRTNVRLGTKSTNAAAPVEAG